MGFWFLPFPVVRTCGVRLSHVVYSGVSWSRDDSAYCGAPLTLRKCGNAGMRRRKEEKLGSYSSDTIDLKKLFFFQTGYLLSLELPDLAMPPSQWVPEIHLSPSLHCWGCSTYHQAWLLFVFYMGPGDQTQVFVASTSPTESSSSSLTWSFSRSDCGKAHFQTYSGRIYLYPDSAILTLDWYWLAHGKSTGNLIYRS